MTPQEHALIVGMLARQAMLFKALVKSLKSQGLNFDDFRDFDAFIREKEEVDPQVFRQTGTLYSAAAKKLGLDAGLTGIET